MISSSTVAKPDRKAPKMKNGGIHRGMPPDRGGAGEVQPDDAVHRTHQRRHDRRQYAVKRMIMPPLVAGAAEAQRHDAVEDLLAAGRRPVAHRRQIRQQTQIPEHHGRRHIGQDGEEIPQQRTAKLRPEIHGVRVGKQPVEEPGTAQMQDRIDPGTRGAEQRHRFGDPVDRVAPLRPGEKEQRRNERAAAGDGDPPDIVDDGEAPGDRPVDAPDADAGIEQIQDRADQHAGQRCRQDDGDPPPAERLGPQGDARHVVGHVGIVAARQRDGIEWRHAPVPDPALRIRAS